MYFLSRWLQRGSILLWAYSGTVVGVAYWPTSGILLVAAAFARMRRRRGQWNILGSAQWADERELKRHGMIGANSGLILGYIYLPPERIRVLRRLMCGWMSSKEACEQFWQLFGRYRREPVRLPQAIHTAVFAPSGAGKGVSVIAHFMMTCADSIAVLDPKGEHARRFAAYREKEFGQPSFVIDPFHNFTDKSDSLNPLDLIDASSPVAIDDAAALAKDLVVRSPEEKEPYFNNSAETWLKALICLVVVYGGAYGSRSLQTVRALLSSPEHLQQAIKLMRESDAWGGMLARMGGQLEQFVDRERASVLTTAQQHTRFLDTPSIAAITQASTFDPAKLKTEKMTVFLILPPEYLRSLSGLLRMWIGCLLRAVVKNGNGDESRVHFILDEAASLGSMEALDDALDKYRSYGVRLQFYYQSLGQLRKCFPEGQDQTLLSNTSQIYFGVNDTSTADLVSQRLGDETIVLNSGGTSSGTTRQHTGGCHPSDSISYSSNTNSNWQFQARRLLKPEEVIALPPRMAITFTPGVSPVCTTLTPYHEERSLRRRGFVGRAVAALRMFALSLICFLLSLVMAGFVTLFVENALRRSGRI
ncbi:Conjugal transfer protein TraG [Caulifigura coniformis]|uniref:Conjugal transfer protein TraG n=1 Tax=Caulifigura coniformis TaxID=2527983 RepID=A0A517SCK3_9PLAN|nr:type IV secretory system conjugative DNA transfer family protein [Caulifigura coniformis]QDT53857.1 Conjugal transfer protein TraG [Caulifigura coniformis]